MNRPVITFVLLCYNQENFIRGAVEGALSQTYSPMQLVISDDCSQDRTFDVVQEMVAAYQGPHRIRINRNLTNLGIGGNFSRALEMSDGELIVAAAGDDISIPERTMIIYEAWNDSGCQATLLHSRHEVIDEHGRALEGWPEEGFVGEQGRFVHQKGTLSNFVRRRQPSIRGATYAISRKLTSLFGPLPKSVTYEDTAFSFRTILMNGLFTFINLPLVKYRRHRSNVTFALHGARPCTAVDFSDYQQKQYCELDRFIAVYQCFEADAEKASRHGLISTAQYPEVKKRILREGRRLQLRRDLLVEGWFRRWAIFFALYCSSIRPRELLTQIKHLLPRGIYRAGLLARNRLLSGISRGQQQN
ncbi:MAG: glycosyltransferase [Verrucomicrobiota bacterium]